eukprot:Gregarina_sp_Poly_1__3990@NODE_2201_length_2493_cov_30_230008_g1418_i0_p2_GENE_NODE_2201_length_2493_cov_30_230008_g1418_i0NODE_2201_length_2493_cov_30_230008_g1418_i0_p2_ORF_typecomplete_len360_score46_99Oxidored_FMN/PF00724_20/8e82Dus/PF01207_17/0_00012IMPDH/PF00478_25/2_1e03IMPDH/PF00478_25/0_24_NODE_2201_length_2493_cov_30_230008_g1418_i014122491
MAAAGTGKANDAHLVHYGSLADGGPGLIIVEATAVLPNGFISPWDLGLWDDDHVEPLKKITSYIHAYTQSKVAIQLAHAGRKGPLLDPMGIDPKHLGPEDKFGCECMAPSAIPFGRKYKTPREMTIHEIAEFKQAMISAGLRAVKAGFDCVEVHNAHGYLLHSFCSPISNQRADEYGGSFDNRIKLSVEIAEQLRFVLSKSIPIIFRISATDWIENGWNLYDSVKLSQRLKIAGVDVIHTSSGGIHESQVIEVGYLYQVPFARAVKHEAGMKTIAVGGITDLETASKIIDSDEADFVASGRAHLQDVYWLRNQELALNRIPWYPTRQVHGFRQSMRKKAEYDQNEHRTVTEREVAADLH